MLLVISVAGYSSGWLELAVSPTLLVLFLEWP